jgi:hypothetical protein
VLQQKLLLLEITIFYTLPAMVDGLAVTASLHTAGTTGIRQ